MHNSINRLSKFVCIILLLGLNTVFVFSQNLIRNSDFEEIESFVYQDPFQAMEFLKDWYPASIYTVDPSYIGTPDLFDVNNPWPTGNGTSFWNVANGSAQGEFFIGLGNHVLLTGFYSPEIIASKLVKPLEGNSFYYVEVSARNKGASTYNDNPPLFCESLPDRRIDVLLHSDSIWMTIDDDLHDSYHNAYYSHSLRSERLTKNEVGSWHRLGTCFQASGHEEYIAFTTQAGMFEVDPPCEIEDDHWDAFYVYYFDLDNVKLVKLNDSYTVNLEICDQENNKINIASHIDLPIMKSDPQYVWEDGTNDSINFIQTAGDYKINVVLDCTSIPIYLNIESSKCTPDFYVPNIFSPNDDHINDVLEISVDVEIEVLDFQFEIYDRWGSKSFLSTDINHHWDGFIHGRPAGKGVYSWNLSFSTLDHSNKKIDYNFSGDILLIR